MMKRFVVIATTVRGVVDPPELLHAADQWEANMAARFAEEADMDTLQRRATRPYQAERDPMLRRSEGELLKAPAQSEVANLCWLSVRAVKARMA